MHNHFADNSSGEPAYHIRQYSNCVNLNCATILQIQFARFMTYQYNNDDPSAYFLHSEMSIFN